MKPRGIAVRTHEGRSTYDLILDVAEARFAERGFAAVSVREIAADVGLKNQASLYHHFRNKRALYEAVLARGVENLVGLFTGGQGYPAADADFTDALDPVVDYLVAHPHLPQLIQRAGMDDPRYLRPTVTRLLRPLYTQGVRILASANAGWEPEDLPLLGAGLFHLIFSYFANSKLLEMVVEDDPLRPALVARQRRFLKHALTQLLSGAAPQPNAPADTGAPAPAIARAGLRPVG